MLAIVPVVANDFNLNPISLPLDTSKSFSFLILTTDVCPRSIDSGSSPAVTPSILRVP